MASVVWRKLQHHNKRATKFRFTARFRELVIECCPTWQPAAVCVAWVHRKRRYVSKVSNWEPSITNPYCGIILWPVQSSEALEIITTLYRDQRAEEFDDKEWTFVVEEVANSGRRFRPIASAKLNLRMFANQAPGCLTELKLQMRPLRESLRKCTLQLLLSCTILKEGAAIDDDMRSLASILSAQPAKDIGDLHDFDDEFGSHGSMTLPVAQHAEAATRPSTNGFIDERWRLQVAEVVNEIGALEKIPSTEVVASHAVPSNNDSFKSTCGAEFQGRTESPKFGQKSVMAGHYHESTDAARQPMMTSTPTETRSSSGFFDSVLSNSLPKRDSTTANDSQASVTSQDLLSWCQETCRGYRGVRISNFSSSWRNGVAFAALIHRYRPDLIDFDSLSPSEIRENCRKAFDAAALLNVPRLIDPNDMVIMTIPDKIAVMTYVYNLKAALTGTSPVNDAGELNSILS
uniref:Calponin-homology (CH) domain-containing protein n=1 Tax=Trichuris muris TaxID=70415 RepID=A0A5S6Q4Y4_TRIMR